MNALYRFIKTWKLPMAMIIGVLLYYASMALPMDTREIDDVYYGVSHYLQPTLIFVMLLLSFLKVEAHDMKPRRWHAVMLMTQGGLFVLCSLAAMAMPETKILWEGAMLCFICPTATASAVIVQKLGGSISGDVTYIILCNLMVSILAPGFLTLVEPHAGITYMTEFFMIMGKVFPLLLCPLFVALILKGYCPKTAAWLQRIPDLAFYLWLVALALAITVTVRTIVESNIAIDILLWLALISAVSCVMQFALGRMIGRHWDDPIAAAQAFGQKNTVFAIWMGLVFLNPITSVVGGFYSIWHNVINSWQLYKSCES